MNPMKRKIYSRAHDFYKTLKFKQDTHPMNSHTDERIQMKYIE